MKKILQRFIPFAIFVCVLGLFGSVITRYSIKQNRDAREQYNSNILEPVRKEVMGKFEKGVAQTEANATKSPKSITPIPIPDFEDLHTKEKKLNEYDESYFSLSTWRIVADGISIGFGLLTLYLYASLTAILRKENEIEA